MDIDMQTLRLLEREREISLDVLVSAIEQALLSAYHRTPGAQTRARVELDRKTGHVTVWAREAAPRRARRRGQPAAARSRRPRVRRHPGRVRPHRDGDGPPGHRAAAARRRGRPGARGVPRQGGRGPRRGHPAGPRPPHGADRRRRHRGGPARARAGPRRGVRARRPDPRLRPRGRPRPARPAGHPVPHAPEPRAQALRARGPRGRRRHASRSPRWRARRATAPRWRSARPSPGVNAKGACIGPMGGRVRAVMAELHGEKIDIVDYADDPAEIDRPRAVARPGALRDGRRPRGARRRA